jgi:hypothetical protein
MALLAQVEQRHPEAKHMYENAVAATMMTYAYSVW